MLLHGLEQATCWHTHSLPQRFWGRIYRGLHHSIGYDVAMPRVVSFVTGLSQGDSRVGAISSNLRQELFSGTADLTSTRLAIQ